MKWSAYGLTESNFWLQRALYVTDQRNGAVDDMAKIFCGRSARYLRSQILPQGVRHDTLIFVTIGACKWLQSGWDTDEQQWYRRKRRPRRSNPRI